MMELNHVKDRFLILVSTREIVLSVFFAALCGGLALSISSVSMMYYINGKLAFQVSENKATVSRVQGEARNLALEVVTCERRTQKCLDEIKANKK